MSAAAVAGSRMADVPFIQAVQSRVARISVSASATRGNGAGVVAAGRSFLARLPLTAFANSRPSVFHQRLDAATNELSISLPAGARSWGLARKLLNIFLRDALYTTYRADAFKLQKVDALLEIPLDSITAGRLRKEAGRRKLPGWPRVKHLTPEVSKSYRLFAAQFAATKGIAPVHLDAHWWGHRDL